MKKHILLLAGILVSSLTFLASAQGVQSDDIVGLWETGSGKARVNIIKSGNYFYGRIVWLKEPLNEEGKPKVDKNNPDESKRTTPLLGYRMLSSFEYKGDNLWEDGTIYDPESGSTYNCKITMDDKNTMNIRGFIGIAAFGRTDVWKRLEMKKKK
ncbi:MAG: DUF2147 domain-containing protein [Sphingobacteriales bacterium]|jgi:uncharacterized protein (DUF2147 family)|nr:DUF2147 domain-containing protein [Sphingobacteriales bacterium]